MKRSELIELARKNGVNVEQYGEWRHIFVMRSNGNFEEIKCCKKLSTLIKFLSDNNIKINN